MTKVASILIAVIAVTNTFALAQSNAQKAFATLKDMPGTWQGTSPEGPVKVTFKVTGGGSAIISEIFGKEDMISMFHMDGDRLLLTHYCSAGNQPRMAASVSPDGKTFTFTYVDATNLSAPDAGHMQQMILTVVDQNHHIEEWIFADQGHEHRVTFDLHRTV